MDINSMLSSGLVNSKAQPDTQSAAPMNRSVQGDSSVVPSNTEAEAVSSEELESTLSQLNQKLANLGQSLSFSVDESTQSSVVKVIDKTTEEVIKQFPTEGSLRIIKNIQNYLDVVQQEGLHNNQSLTGTLINEII